MDGYIRDLILGLRAYVRDIICYKNDMCELFYSVDKYVDLMETVLKNEQIQSDEGLKIISNSRVLSAGLKGLDIERISRLTEELSEKYTAISESAMGCEAMRIHIRELAERYYPLLCEERGRMHYLLRDLEKTAETLHFHNEEIQLRLGYVKKFFEHLKNFVVFLKRATDDLHRLCDCY